MITKKQPDSKTQTSNSELCAHGLRDTPVTRRSASATEVLAKEKRFENIKFDINNEARIMTEQLLKLRTMAVFRNPNLRKLPTELHKSHIEQLSERTAQILKNEGRVLHQNFSYDLGTIAQEILATDPSRDELQKSIVECLEKHLQ